MLVDAGYRPDVVRHQLKERFAHEIRDSGIDIVAPYGARILPSRGKSIETGNHLIDLSDGTNRKPRQRMQYPALVGLHTNMLKDAIYEVLLRDRRLPDAAPRQVMWPVDQDAKGYTQAYFREFSNEVRNLHRTPAGQDCYALGSEGRPGEEERGVGLPNLRDRGGDHALPDVRRCGAPVWSAVARGGAGHAERRPLDGGRDGEHAEAFGYYRRFGLCFRRQRNAAQVTCPSLRTGSSSATP